MALQSTFITTALLTVIVIFCNCHEGCKKETFQNTTVKLSMDEFAEFSKTSSITGCISPQTESQRIIVLECYNQHLPVLREEAVANMTELKTMIFMNNSISKVMWAAFLNLPKLEELILSNNKIKLIDVGVFSILPSVSTLRLNGNQLSFLGHGIFTSMPNLWVLNLRYNQLDLIEHEWFDINSNLRILDMSHNLIRQVHDKAFSSTQKLEVIDLSHNLILTIGENAFKGLTDLLELNIGNNRIFQLTGDVFAPAVNLDDLYLHGNNLTYIHEKVLEGINPKLQEISIYGNPWQCGCYYNIQKWMNKQRSNLKVDSTIDCKVQLNPVCVAASDNFDECLEDPDEELNDVFYEQFNKNNDTCELRLSHV